MPTHPPASRSNAAAVVRSWPTSTRRQLGIDPFLVAVLDLVVTGCAVVIDDDDPRPWYERLDQDMDSLLDQALDGLDPAEAMKRFETIVMPGSEEIGGWIKKLGGQSGASRYLMRALGSGRYYRIRKALKADAAVVVVAIRRLLRWLLPFTVAVDDCASILTSDQLATIFKACGQKSDTSNITASMLNLVLRLDGEIDRVIKVGVPLPQATTRADERGRLEVVDIKAYAAKMRAVVNAQSRSDILELSQALANKIQGAQDAMEHSADPVSQASNSLIELIDRLLREAFAEDDVMQWVNDNLAGEDLTFVDERSGRRRPTKRAQALCFAYAGRQVEQRSPISEIGAAGLVAARTQLQALKHADQGTSEERARLQNLLGAVEAYLVVSLRIGWSIYASGEDLQRLRARFVPAA